MSDAARLHAALAAARRQIAAAGVAAERVAEHQVDGEVGWTIDGAVVFRVELGDDVNRIDAPRGGLVAFDMLAIVRVMEGAAGAEA